MIVLMIEDCDDCTQYPECNQVRVTDGVENPSDPRGYYDVRSWMMRSSHFIAQTNMVDRWEGYDFSNVVIRGPLAEELMMYKFCVEMASLGLEI